MDFVFIYFYFSDHTLWILFKKAAQISTILQQYLIPKACPLRPHGSDLDNRPKYWKYVFGGLFVKAIWFRYEKGGFFSLLSKRKEKETFWKIILVVYCVNYCYGWTDAWLLLFCWISYLDTANGGQFENLEKWRGSNTTRQNIAIEYNFFILNSKNSKSYLFWMHL